MATNDAGNVCAFLERLMMAGDRGFELLDLSGVHIRVRGLLRWMQVETVGQLLELSEQKLLSTKHCGPKTVARILQLQAEYGKDITPAKPRENINEVLGESIRNTARLVAVARAANEVVDGAKKDRHNRYYFRVTTKRFNMLIRAVEALGKRS